MTKVEAGKVVRWFKKNLGLLGWKVTIVIGDNPPSEMNCDIPFDERSNWLGGSKSNIPYHKTDIWVNEKAHDNPKCDEVDTLMHELIHSFMDECGVDYRGGQGEFFVNKVAGVLAKQYGVDNG